MDLDLRSLGITTQTLVYKGGLETTNYRSKIYLNFALNFSKITLKNLFIFKLPIFTLFVILMVDIHFPY
jgi:hypothetical protein